MYSYDTKYAFNGPPNAKLPLKLLKCHNFCTYTFLSRSSEIVHLNLRSIRQSHRLLSKSAIGTCYRLWRQHKAMMHLILLTQLHLIDNKILQIPLLPPPPPNIPDSTPNLPQGHSTPPATGTRVFLLSHMIKWGISKKSLQPNFRTTEDYEGLYGKTVQGHGNQIKCSHLNC